MTSKVTWVLWRHKWHYLWPPKWHWLWWRPKWQWLAWFNKISRFGDKTNTIVRRINLELENISNWLKANKLSINVKKTKSMLFHRPSPRCRTLKLQINGVEIERVTDFDFLGLLINDGLSWTNHLHSLNSKIASAAGILHRLKYSVPKYASMMIYNALVSSRLNYMTFAWGQASEPIFSVQKRAIRNVTRSGYLAHTSPLFKSTRTLKLEDIYKISKLKLYHGYVNKKLPSYFLRLELKRGTDIHDHYTRICTQYRRGKVGTNYAKQIFSFSIPFFVKDNAIQCVVSKAPTLTRQSFTKFAKSHYISKYIEICNDKKCYSCSKQKN